MQILFITAAIYPYSGQGPGAESCAALPKALRSLGHTVTVLSPMVQGVDPATHSLARRLSKVEVEVDGATIALDVHTGRSPAGVDLVFLGHDELTRAVGALDDPRALRAFAVGAAAYLARGKITADVVHGCDAAGALALAALRDADVAITRALSVHEPKGRAEELPAGLDAADVLLVPSASVANALGDRHPVVVTVPGGIDPSVWSPLTDPGLPARFDPVDPRGKARCKEAAQRAHALPVRGEVPLFLVIPDETGGGTLAAFAEVASDLLRNDCQVVCALGEVHEALGARLRELDARWSDRIRVLDALEASELHRLLAAADFSVLAPDAAPTASRAMQAHRYGTIPIARRVGALPDVIVDCDPALRSGTGLLFDGDADSLLGALQRGLAAHASDGFGGLRARCMKLDHGWERAARVCERSYRAVEGERAA